jgi:hypothetical protein
MNTKIGAGEANAALDEVGRRRGQVADVATVPFWFWLVVGVAMVGLATLVDTRSTNAIAVGVPGFVLVVLAATAAVVVPRYRRAQWRNDLLGTPGAIAIVGFVWVIVGGTLGIAFGLRAADVPHPATIACALGALGLVCGGPVLSRQLLRITTARR